jgi:hypothetical protein
MRKFREVLRLRFELAPSQHEIARSCSISQANVSKCLKRARAADVNWPLPEGWDEARLEEALFARPPAPLRNPPAPAGPCQPAPGTAIQPSPDAAIVVGGVPPEPPRRFIASAAIWMWFYATNTKPAKSSIGVELEGQQAITEYRLQFEQLAHGLGFHASAHTRDRYWTMQSDSQANLADWGKVRQTIIRQAEMLTAAVREHFLSTNVAMRLLWKRKGKHRGFQKRTLAELDRLIRRKELDPSRESDRSP